MKIGKQELFNTEEINTYVGKFEGKINDCNSTIAQLKSGIAQLELEVDMAIEKDILEGSASSKKELSNITARKANSESQLEIELKKLTKIREIMMSGLAKMVPEASKKMQADLSTFNSAVEKSVYKQLSDLRDKQSELLLSLQVAHNAVITDIFSYNEICHFAGLKQYEKTATNELFHNNLFMPHRNYSEYGAPLLNCHSLPYIQEHLSRARADQNAQFNRYKSKEEKEQLPLPKEYKDIDLQKFLDNL